MTRGRLRRDTAPMAEEHVVEGNATSAAQPDAVWALLADTGTASHVAAKFGRYLQALTEHLARGAEQQHAVSC